MFNLTGSEIIVILLLALVVLGPEKLPDAIRRVGKTYAELRKLGTGFQEEFKAAMEEPMREMRESAEALRRSADFSDDTSKGARPHGTSTNGSPSTGTPTTGTPTTDIPTIDIPTTDSAPVGPAAPQPEAPPSSTPDRGGDPDPR